MNMHIHILNIYTHCLAKKGSHLALTKQKR